MEKKELSPKNKYCRDHYAKNKEARKEAVRLCQEKRKKKIADTIEYLKGLLDAHGIEYSIDL